MRGARIKATFITLFLLCLFIGQVEGELVDGRPAPRFGHRMVYDPVNERVLLFGGAIYDNGYTYYNDLLSYDYSTSTWTEIECDLRPPGRFNFMMVYDTDRHQLVLFGGFTASDRAGDTWTYDIEGNIWTNMHPMEGPSTRSDSAIVYDEENGIVILSNGYTRDDSHPQDTWVYDVEENTWTQMRPEESPLPQYGHHMVYDTANEAVVMYGGHWSITEDGRMVSHGYSDGVWTYDYPSDTWTKVDTATSLPQRYWHTFAYDKDRGKMVVFGGSGTSATLGDTWLYNLSTNTWERLDTYEKPPERENSVLVYDPVHEKFILFGGLMEVGAAPLNDLWVLNPVNGEWLEVSTEIVEVMDEGSEQIGIQGFPTVSVMLGMILAGLFLSRRLH